ncbi:MAG: hypothetical protein NC311_12730 [Muribaculaceae bacterium]|nr:hypothetical protein [Muribaculaceae bacterium]
MPIFLWSNNVTRTSVGNQDFVVYTVVWEIPLVAVVLRGASAGMRRGVFFHYVEAASQSPVTSQMNATTLKGRWTASPDTSTMKRSLRG